MQNALPELFGYDPVLLAQLEPRRRSTIALLSEAWIISSTALAASVGYALWLVEHSVVLSLVCSAGMGLVVLNLLRLVIAGSGAAPHLSEESVRDYRPALGPTFVLSMLAALLAQPAQLPLWQEQLAPAVAVHRAHLIDQQEALARELGQPVHAEFRDELAHSEFLAFRVRAIWEAPQRAFMLSALYWFLVLLPTLTGRFIALNALREYERARWLAARVQIQHEGEDAFARMDAALAPYPSYRRPLYSSLSAPFGGKVSFLARARTEPPATTRDKQ